MNEREKALAELYGKVFAAAVLAQQARGPDVRAEIERAEKIARAAVEDFETTVRRRFS